MFVDSVLNPVDELSDAGEHAWSSFVGTGASPADHAMQRPVLVIQVANHRTTAVTLWKKTHTIGPPLTRILHDTTLCLPPRSLHDTHFCLPPRSLHDTRFCLPPRSLHDTSLPPLS